MLDIGILISDAEAMHSQPPAPSHWSSLPPLPPPRFGGLGAGSDALLAALAQRTELVRGQLPVDREGSPSDSSCATL